MSDRSTDDDLEYWRAGCECARAGLCYRCKAAAEIGRLRSYEGAWKEFMRGLGDPDLAAAFEYARKWRDRTASTR